MWSLFRQSAQQDEAATVARLEAATKAEAGTCQRGSIYGSALLVCPDGGQVWTLSRFEDACYPDAAADDIVSRTVRGVL